MKSISNQTKNGARKMACTRLSRSAGALPSNFPCPTNWAIQHAMLIAPAHELAVAPYVDVRWFAYAVLPIRIGAIMAPATGSMRMYKVEYRTAPAVPTLSGRLGTESHDGMGTAGVLVSYCHVRGAAMRAVGLLTSRKDVNRIGGTQSRCIPTLT